jgi:GNAT superfamily N-acetyltransferase
MDAVIDVVGMDELPGIVDLYNQIFRPARDIESFRRRYLGRYNVLQLVASVQEKPVGFFLGFELKPDTFFAWFYGVHPEFRRHGIATQLMEAAHDWGPHAQLRFDAGRVPQSSPPPVAPVHRPRVRHRRHPLGQRPGGQPDRLREGAQRVSEPGRHRCLGEAAPPG